MDYKDIIKKVKPEMEKSLQFLERELQKIRTSRVSPSLIEDIEVECFGQKFPLKQLAAISVGESRELIIQPWDKSYIESIEKALSKSGPSGSAVVDKDIIRLSFPALSEDYRKDLIKKVCDLGEAVRQTVRKWREKAWDEIQDKTREGEIREDDKFRAKKELQDLIDEYNDKIEKLVEAKKEEILE